jgi:hypothetical protein
MHKFYVTTWFASSGEQGDSPPYPRRAWYFPFRSEEACRDCASQGDAVAIQILCRHEGGDTNA